MVPNANTSVKKNRMLASKQGFESWLFSPDSFNDLFNDLYSSDDNFSGDEDEGCSRCAQVVLAVLVTLSRPSKIPLRATIPSSS